MKVVTVTVITVFILLSLPFVLPKKEITKYSDEKLREIALSRGMESTPATFQELLKVIDNSNNPLTKEKIALGKTLFFDKNISKHNDINCATCHMITKDANNTQIMLNAFLSNDSKITNCAICHLGDQSGVDRFETAIGDQSKENPFHLNTLTILNSSLAKYFSWSGNSKNIEEQIALCIQAPFSMNAKPKDIEQKFHNQQLKFQDIQYALGAYVKTLITRGNYDRFLDGNNSAISNKAKRGLSNFINFGCKGCHTGISVGGQSLQKFPLRRLATVYDLRVNLTFEPTLEVIDDTFPFENKGGFLGNSNTQRFRVPILRNVTKTSPYFHNGAVIKIEEAVDTMAQHQLGRKLTNEQIEEIVAFLKTLEGDIVDYSIK